MSDDRQKVYIRQKFNKVLRLSVLIVHFVVLIGGFWINHAFLGDGLILQLILAVFFFLSLYSFLDRSETAMTEDEAREHFCRKAIDQ